MRSYSTAGWYRAVTLAMCCAAACVAQEEGQEMPSEKASKEHEMLAKDVGTWVADMKVYMAGPKSEPMIVPAKEINTLMPGGLWLISQFESGPFQGHGVFGYDSMKKKYVGTWIDNSTSHMSVMSGDYDKKADELVMYFSSVDAMTKKPEKMKSAAKYLDDDTKEFKMYRWSESSNEWELSFEITYKRAKTG